MAPLKRIALVLALLGTAALAPFAPAQQYPNKPIRLLIPSPPGGGTDILGRILKEGLTDLWLQPVVVDNRGGARKSTARAQRPHCVTHEIGPEQVWAGALSWFLVTTTG